MRKSLGAVVGLAMLLLAGGASAAVPVADLQLVSMTADVHHARVGQSVTWTITARNNGPDPVEVDLNCQPSGSDFSLPGGPVCSSGVSSDGPFCEWIQPSVGELFTLTESLTVNASAPRLASNTACAISFDGFDRDDPNPANDCMTKTLRIVGRR
jgi:hypothetical protein